MATPTEDSGIFTGSGGTTTTIADTSGGTFSDFGFFGAPSINNTGTVAFFAGLTNPTGCSGIFTGNGLTTTTIADSSSGDFGCFGPAPAINDTGTVAFFASLGSGGTGIFTGNGITTTLIVDDSGPFSGFDQVASINNVGTVAFLASLTSGGSGLFTGTDPVANRVIGSGDALFGSTVTTLTFFREGLNNQGQLAFVADLDDGRTVVVRADPVAIPEPSFNWSLLASATLGIGYVLKTQASSKIGKRD